MYYLNNYYVYGLVGPNTRVYFLLEKKEKYLTLVRNTFLSVIVTNWVPDDSIFWILFYNFFYGIRKATVQFYKSKLYFLSDRTKFPFRNRPRTLMIPLIENRSANLRKIYNLYGELSIFKPTRNFYVLKWNFPLSL